MFARFFIDRPIFASVLSIVAALAGGIAVFTLPVTQYPEITPPTVEVAAVYPGANAKVVAESIAAPIEQQVNGVEDMMYMSSQCTNDGTYTLTATFKPGTNLNIAQVLVQNRVSLALPVLPDLVKRRGVTVKKKSPAVLMIVNLFSTDGSRKDLYLSNYATIQLRDELARLEGVGDISYLGQRDYSMRVWLDPERMAALNMTASDIIRVIEQQNVQVAAGQVGQPPAPPTQSFQYTINTLGRLSEPRQFGEMVLRTDVDGRVVRMKDVAKVDLGALGYDQACTLDGRPSVALSVYQLPGSNALKTAQRVRDKMAELKTRFPEGLDYAIVYDTTPFIRESVHEVFRTLVDAVVLVAVVMLVFLQSWRSAIIPLAAVPVAVIGTFAAMALAGFSINNLTLFGLVLAIGIVVDDAIVVVEAVEHHIEQGLSPRDATIRAMDEVAGPVIAIGLVLAAVFVPCIFIAGIIGEFFRQFAVTIAISTLISAFNSLTLSPALCALLLKRGEHGNREPLPRAAFPLAGGWLGYAFLTEWVLKGIGLLPAGIVRAIGPQLGWLAPVLGTAAGMVAGYLLRRALNRWLGIAFRKFNNGFAIFTGGYLRAVRVILRATVLGLIAYAGLIYLTYKVFTETPTGFITEQDKGYLLVNVQLPDSASLGRTDAAMRRIDQVARKMPGVKHTVAVSGQSLLLGANAPNFGTVYVMLDDFDNRATPDRGAEAIMAKLRESLEGAVPDGLINVFGAPPVDGLGTAGGIKIVIEDRADLGLAELQTSARKVVADGNDEPALRGLFTGFRADTPWLFLEIDRAAAQTAGVSMAEVDNTLQAYFGSLYVNDFNRFGRTWQVNLQAAPQFRQKIGDVGRLKARSDRGRMVPLAGFVKDKEVSGPVLVQRYNLYTAAAVNGTPGPGISTGEAISKLGEVAEAAKAPSMRAEWTELALLQLQAGNTSFYAFVLSVVLVFLVLAAQYESWALPLAVILVVPMCLLCAASGVAASGMDINIFTQVGLVVLVGLASKNAILIVEFAKNRREEGMSRREATLEACRLRLRPIIMTSFAFILGVVPLVLAQGAGAEMRRLLGTAVFYGMLGVTIFGIFLTPLFFFVIQWLTDLRRPNAQPPVTIAPVDANGSVNGQAAGGSYHLPSTAPTIAELHPGAGS